MSTLLSGPRHLSVPMASPIINRNDQAFTLEVFPQQQVAACEIAAQRETALVITDATTALAGNALLEAISAAEKEVKARTAALTAPLKQTVEAINGMRDELINLLNPAKRSLQDKLLTFDREQKAKKAAAEAAAAEEQRKAKEAAEAERKRLQAIADKEHAEKVATAQAKADAEAKELAALLGAPVEPEAVKVEPAPIIAAPAVPLTTRTLMPSKPVEIAVTTRTDRKVEITDLRALCRFVADGGSLDLVQANTVAVKNSIISGTAVPGAQLVEVQTAVNKGARS